jgi:hypothetical protein
MELALVVILQIKAGPEFCAKVSTQARRIGSIGDSMTESSREQGKEKYASGKVPHPEEKC